jgi:outer membrane protein
MTSSICKTSKIIGILSLLSIVSSSVWADNGSAGRTIFKGKVIGVIGTAKQNSSEPVPFFDPIANKVSSYPSNSASSLGSGLGVSGSAAYYMTDHVAIELAATYFNHKIKTFGTGPQYITNPATQAITVSPGQQFSQSTIARLIPISATIQYHIAPYGKLIPYVGVGYHHTIAAASAGSSLRNVSGLVLQAGVSSWYDENIMIDFDVKKYTMNTKLSYKNNQTLSTSDNTVPVSTNLSLSPIIISAGVGIRF